MQSSELAKAMVKEIMQHAVEDEEERHGQVLGTWACNWGWALKVKWGIVLVVC